MLKHSLMLLAAAAALGAGVASAQDTATAVRPGMTEADVRARWGEPVAVRRINDWTYLFYANGLETEWGYFDTVFLQGGQVVDAIVRAPWRAYLGQSSSPPERLPEFTPPARPPTPPPGAGAPGVVGGVRVNVLPAPNRTAFPAAEH